MKISDEEYDRLKNIELEVIDYVYHRGEYENLISCVKPIKSKLYAGYTEAQWQQIVDNKFDCRHPAHQDKWKKLDNLNNLEDFTVDNIELRREIGHRQPCFGVKPNISDQAVVITKNQSGHWGNPNKSLHFYSVWDIVTEFIQLTDGITNV